ncbi:hypothetical protein [Thermoleptolyngbya sp.]
MMRQPLTSKALEMNPKSKSMMTAWIEAIQGMNPGLSQSVHQGVHRGMNRGDRACVADKLRPLAASVPPPFL